MATLIPIERRVARAQVLHGTRPWMGQDGHGVPLPMVLHQARAVLLARRMVAAKQAGGCGDGPRAGGMAELRPGGCLGTRDERARGDAFLPAWQAAERLDVVAPYQGQERAAPGDRA